MLFAASCATASGVNPNFPEIERQVKASFERCRSGVVRIAWNGSGRFGYQSGVIITADGCVATIGSLPRGQTAAIILADGRQVTGKVLGSWETALLLKIIEPGPWPTVAWRKSTAVKAGELCVAVGYPFLYGKLPQYDTPSLCFGQSVAEGTAPDWLCTSCRINTDGGGLFDLEGRLIAINVTTWPSDGFHLGIDTFIEHWNDLTGRTGEGSRLATASKPTTSQLRCAQQPPSRDNTASGHPTGAEELARLASVGLAWGPDRAEGWSGTIVNPEGYIATCADHWRLAGELVTVHLADGRAVPGKVLRSEPLRDIGVVRIIDKGPWPFVRLGRPAELKKDDPCLVLGYPIDFTNPSAAARWRELRLCGEGHVIDTAGLPLAISTSCGISNGDSGGGGFDSSGRLIGINSIVGPPAVGPAVGLFQHHWAFLASDAPITELPRDGHGEIAWQFEQAASKGSAAVVEVLRDKKRCALGTVVDGRGTIITKASVLYGEPRLPLRRRADFIGAMHRPLERFRFRAAESGSGGPAGSRLEQSRGDSRGHADRRTCFITQSHDPPCSADTTRYCFAERRSRVLCHASGSCAERGFLSVCDRFEPDSDGVRVHSVAGYEEKSPLHDGDIVVSVEGQPTPDMQSFLALTEQPNAGVAVAIAGDPIRLRIRRQGKLMEVCFPLPPENTTDRGESLRRSAFPAVFDADIMLLPDLCGGPLVDSSGEAVGIAIACRAEDGPVYVVPSATVRRVVDELVQAAFGEPTD